MTHPGSLTPDELGQMARDMDRAVIMAEVRASIQRIRQDAAGVFVRPAIKDAIAHLAQLNAIAEAREADAREGIHV